MYTIEDVPATVPAINRFAWLHFANDLRRRARPGNTAWRKLEELTGNDGDYLPADAGEPPKGA